MIIKKAFDEANKSVNQVKRTTSFEYDPDAPDVVVHLKNDEQKRQHKELMLTQHRELKELDDFRKELRDKRRNERKGNRISDQGDGEVCG